jgi:hypothetical protein
MLMVVQERNLEPLVHVQHRFDMDSKDWTTWVPRWDRGLLESVHRTHPYTDQPVRILYDIQYSDIASHPMIGRSHTNVLTPAYSTRSAASLYSPQPMLLVDGRD